MKKLILGILFDKDGTLLDFQKSWKEPNQKAAYLAAVGDEELARKLLLIGGMDPDTRITKADSELAAGNTHDISEAWIKAGSPLSYDLLMTALDSVFVEAAQYSVPVSGLSSTISHLVDQGYVLGVASSDSEAAIETFLNIQNIRSNFSFIAGYDSGFGHKPSAGMLEGFCAATGLLPEQVAVVGDNTHDLEMAKAGRAGLSIGVLTGTGCFETLSPLSDVVLQSIEKLTTIKNWQEYMQTSD